MNFRPGVLVLDPAYLSLWRRSKFIVEFDKPSKYWAKSSISNCNLFFSSALLGEIVRSFAGQFPDSFDKGTLGDFGKYDQCLNSQFPISTRYCMASFIPDEKWMRKHNLNKNEQIINQSSNIEFIPEIGLSMKIGLCVPNVCSSSDITRIYDDGERPIFDYLNKSKITSEASYTGHEHSINDLAESFKLYFDPFPSSCSAQ